MAKMFDRVLKILLLSHNVKDIYSYQDTQLKQFAVSTFQWENSCSDIVDYGISRTLSNIYIVEIFM